jgi:hypothetical protein
VTTPTKFGTPSITTRTNVTPLESIAAICSAKVKSNARCYYSASTVHFTGADPGFSEGGVGGGAKLLPPHA